MEENKQTITQEDYIPISTDTVTTKASHETAQPVGIASLGINGSALLFQLLNFFILYLVLRKFVFTPITKVLHERQQAIKSSLENAQKIAEEKKSWEEKQIQIQNEAVKNSTMLIAKAKSDAEDIRLKTINDVKKQQELIIYNTKIEIDNLKTEMVREAKKELTSLVILAAKKATKDVINDVKDAEIITKSLRNKS